MSTSYNKKLMAQEEDVIRYLVKFEYEKEARINSSYEEIVNNPMWKHRTIEKHRAHRIGKTVARMVHRAEEPKLERVLDEQAYFFKAHVTGIPFEQRSNKVAIPKNAWQMLKQDYAPAWFLKRYPVQYTYDVFKYTPYKTVCPHIDPTNKECLEWLTYADGKIT